MNIIEDEWIPVRYRGGGRGHIAPWQIAEGEVAFPDWPRPDLNLACLELLIGLVYISAPPAVMQIGAATPPSAQELRTALQRFAPAFELLGEGPRFMQELGGFEGGKRNLPDMLFIDSAGENTAKQNKDVMVHRDRYDRLDLPMAAMALYTLQQYAPSGGAGNRTSMRGGGPLVTLVEPKNATLWDIVWANTPKGVPLEVDDLTVLPWMRPLRTHQPTDQTVQGDPNVDKTSATSPSPEVFFGQPRRIWLETDRTDDASVIAVWQKPYGNNYAGWQHPLTPYYISKPDAPHLPRLAKPGNLYYPFWAGIVYDSLSQNMAKSVADYKPKQRQGHSRLIVGGWAMSNMSPQDFQWRQLPLWQFDEEGTKLAQDLSEAGRIAANALGWSLNKALSAEKQNIGYRAEFKDQFFAHTQKRLIEHFNTIATGAYHRNEICTAWLQHSLRRAALDIFDAATRARILNASPREREYILGRRKDDQKSPPPRRALMNTFQGKGSFGKSIFKSLDLPLHLISKKETAQ